MLVSFLLGITSVFADSAVRFEIDAPTIVEQNIPFDVRIRAVDKYGNIDTQYNNSIIFSTDWIADVVPMNQVYLKNGEIFLDDQIIFKRTGNSSLYVIDDNDIVGERKIQVQDKAVNIKQGNFPRDNNVIVEQNPTSKNSHSFVQNPYTNILPAPLMNSQEKMQNLSENSFAWSLVHCSLVARGFLWAQPIGGYINPRTCGFLENNFIKFPHQSTMTSLQPSGSILAENYWNMRKEISDLQKFAVKNYSDAILVLKKFDAIIQKFQILPKNILFSEYPDFIRMYFAFFPQQEMQTIAHKENIKFLQEYARIINEKKRDDIALILSYTPNFEYIINKYDNDFSLNFSIHSVDGTYIDEKDLDITFKNLPQDWNIHQGRISFRNIDASKKYSFIIEAKKKNAPWILRREVFVRFAEPKIIDTISLEQAKSYKILWWELSYEDLDKTNTNNRVNVFYIPHGNGIVATLRKMGQFLGDSRGAKSMIDRGELFLNHTQIDIYNLFKYFYNQV